MRKTLRDKRIIALLLLTALLGAGMRWVEAAQSVAWGSRGDTVSAVQRKLKQWGYYSGAIDGVFGQGTYTAVVSFQKKNGLKADGVVGASTAAAMGIQLGVTAVKTAATSGYGSSDVQLLARLIYGEARGEPYTGKVAVGAVVLNRVRSSKFPNTIAGVIYQPGAFDAVSDGQINLTPDSDSLRAARDAMNGWDPTGGCVYYYNPNTATSSWIWSRPVQLRIGKHNFSV
jgi:N-acetylmuramoyl-L-alanine amidase